MIPPFLRAVLLVSLGLASLVPAARAGDANPRGPVATTQAEVEARMHPFTGTRAPGGSDPTTLDGKVVCGYQGWFAAPGDGSGRGWVHYGHGDFSPGKATVDFWPDMSEYPPGEQYPTGFKYPDGTPATVFSSYNPKTVDRHFAWMEKYGIDGAFVQRFAGQVRTPQSYDAMNAVLDNVRAAANAHGRTWAVMYDFSGLQAGDLPTVVKADWKALVDRMQVTKDPSYQQYKGKPLVIVWGLGFDDGRKYTLQECADFVDFLKNDPKYGGNAVMLGVPSQWREGIGDAVADPLLQEIAKKADIVSPWAPGRYGTVEQFDKRLATLGKGDLDWCKQAGISYMPVIYPGFSWVNLQGMRGRDAHNQTVLRGDGTFFWNQGAGWIGAGVKTLYVAMFDEIDEGTAILKCTNTPPAPGASTFQTFQGQPSDHYLWLAGQLGKTLKGEIPLRREAPHQP